MRNVPLLGFPEEAEDKDGDYICRPRKDLIACVYRSGFGDNGDYIVSIVRWRRGESLSDAWADAPALFDCRADCALQAQACIQHYMDTNPPFTPTANNGDPNGEN